MTRQRIATLVAICACGAAAAGCGSRTPDDIASERSHKAMLESGVSEPGSADEAAILERIPGLSDGQEATVGAATVEVKRTYFAASGRTCKAVTLLDGAGDAGGAAKHLTVCEVDGEWAYVPEVVSVPASPEPDR
jgi:hypothetical protein